MNRIKTTRLPLGFNLGHGINDIEYFSYFPKKINSSKIFSVSLITLSLALLLFSSEQAYAVTTITWDSPAYTPMQGDALGINPFPIQFTVEDTDLALNLIIDSIIVQITSSTGDSTTLTLVEDPADNGIFRNTKLIFMYEQSGFGIFHTATLTIFDDCSSPDPMGNTNHGNCDPNLVDTLIDGLNTEVIVGSNSDPAGFIIDFVETGPNTSIFTTTLKFSTISSDPLTSTLLVSPGDTITVLDVFTGALVNGIIIPPPTADIGAIVVEEGGTVTASYNGISELMGVDPTGIPGRGGGGAVRPGLVLNFIASIGGPVLCDGDCIKPTLGLDFKSQRIVENGFSFNGNQVNVETFYTPFPLITVNVGQKNTAVLKIYENSGNQQIEHVDLAFGLAKGKSISESKAVIIWARNIAGNETVSVKDPENALQDVSVVSENGPCSKNNTSQCLILKIFHTFRQPLEFNMVGTNVWDTNRNAQQNYFNHGLEIVGKSLNPPTQLTVLDYRGYPHTITLVDKDKANDENGNAWLRDGEFWIREEGNVNRLDYTIDSHGIDRNHNLFSSYKRGQEILAESVLKEITFGKSIQNKNFGTNYKQQILWNFDEEKYDLFLEQKKDLEIKRAEFFAKQYYDIEK